jgi:agmatine/peptidylarginine deiminase
MTQYKVTWPDSSRYEEVGEFVQEQHGQTLLEFPYGKSAWFLNHKVEEVAAPLAEAVVETVTTVTGVKLNLTRKQAEVVKHALELYYNGASSHATEIELAIGKALESK